MNGLKYGLILSIYICSSANAQRIPNFSDPTKSDYVRDMSDKKYIETHLNYGLAEDARLQARIEKLDSDDAHLKTKPVGQARNRRLQVIAATEYRRDEAWAKAAQRALRLYDLKPPPGWGEKSVFGYTKGKKIPMKIAVGNPAPRVLKIDGKDVKTRTPPPISSGAAYYDGLIIMYPKTFRDALILGTRYLPCYLFHEVEHYKQYTRDADKKNYYLREAEIYEKQRRYCQSYLGFTDAEVQWFIKEKNRNLEISETLNKYGGEESDYVGFGNQGPPDVPDLTDMERSELQSLAYTTEKAEEFNVRYGRILEEFKKEHAQNLEKERKDREQAAALERMARQMKKEQEEQFLREKERRETATRPSRAWVFPTYSEEEQAIRNWIFKLFAEAKKCGHFPGRTLPSGIENSWARSYDRYIEFLATYKGWDEDQGFDLGYSFGFQLHGDLEVMKARFLMRNACENVWNSNLVQPCNDSFNLVSRSWKDESFRYGWLTITDGNFAARSCLSHMYKNENPPRDWDDLARRIKKYRDAVNAKNERISREADEDRRTKEQAKRRQPYRSRPEMRDCLWGNCVDLPSSISVPSL